MEQRLLIVAHAMELGAVVIVLFEMFVEVAVVGLTDASLGMEGERVSHNDNVLGLECLSICGDAPSGCVCALFC